MVINTENVNTINNIFNRIDEVLDKELNIVYFSENLLDMNKYKEKYLYILLHQNLDQVVILNSNYLSTYLRFKYSEYFIIDKIFLESKQVISKFNIKESNITTELLLKFINSDFLKKRMKAYKRKIQKEILQDFDKYQLNCFNDFITPILFSDKFAITYSTLFLQDSTTEIDEDLFFSGLNNLVLFYNKNPKAINIDIEILINKSFNILELCKDINNKNLSKKYIKIFLAWLNIKHNDIYDIEEAKIEIYNRLYWKIMNKSNIESFKNELDSLSKKDIDFIVSNLENDNLLHNILSSDYIYAYNDYNLFTNILLKTILKDDYILNVSDICNSSFNKLLKNNNNQYNIFDDINICINHLFIKEDKNIFRFIDCNLDIKKLYINKDQFGKTKIAMEMLGLEINDYINNYELVNIIFDKNIIKITDLK